MDRGRLGGSINVFENSFPEDPMTLIAYLFDYRKWFKNSFMGDFEGG